MSLLMLIAGNAVLDDPNRRIAIQIIKNYATISTITVNTIAQISNTTSTAVNKFCISLGYRNFKEFKTALSATCNVRKAQMQNRFQVTDVKKIEETFNLLTDDSFDWNTFSEQIEKANILLHEAKRVIVLGAVFPVMLSLQFDEDMNMMNVFVYPQQINRDIVFKQHEEPTVYLIISLTGRIFRYCRDAFDSNDCSKDRFIVLGNGSQIPSKMESYSKRIYIPSSGDDDAGNTLIITALQYLKYRYSEVYYGSH